MPPPPLVLAYHCIGRLPRAQDPDNLVVPPEQFTAQVERLKQRGYEFVTATEFGRRLHAGTPLRSVCALTFDDGSEDNARVLPGLLKALGVPATLFVCPGLLGEPHPFLAPESGVRLMDRDELLETAANPLIEIGSHTNRHANLSAAGAQEAYAELRSSKEGLEALLGRPVESLAYPFCLYSPACPDAARRAGYVCAVTCGARGALVPYELHREMVDPLDGRLTFALKSRGVFSGLRASPPGRVARRLARPFRHPSAA